MPNVLLLVVLLLVLVLLLFFFRWPVGERWPVGGEEEEEGFNSLQHLVGPDDFPTPPDPNFQALVDAEVSNFPTYHADYSQVDTSSSWMRDPNGNVVNMPFAGKPTSFTYYAPGTLAYSPQTYVPNYTESVFLSAANNNNNSTTSSSSQLTTSSYQGFSFEDNPDFQSTFV